MYNYVFDADTLTDVYVYVCCSFPVVSTDGAKPFSMEGNVSPSITGSTTNTGNTGYSSSPSTSTPGSSDNGILPLTLTPETSPVGIASAMTK